MAITPVTDTFGVAPQLVEAEMAEVKALGYTTIINNRPDGEPGHPSDSAIVAKLYGKEIRRE